MYNNRLKIPATIMLAFVIMLFISLFTTALNHQSEKKTSVKTESPKKTLIVPKPPKKERAEIKVAKDTKIIEKNVVKEAKPKAVDVSITTNKVTTSMVNTDTTKVQESITQPEEHHKATWYRTEGTRVHKPHPTAAYNFAPRGAKLLVTNNQNGKSCVVEVTDRMGKNSKNHIDLSHSAFGMLANHAYGKISVIVKILD